MTVMLHPELVEEPVIQKLELSASLRYDFLKKLRSTNTHRGSLYPDLDGFSRSLFMDWQVRRDEIEKQMAHQLEPPHESDEST